MEVVVGIIVVGAGAVGVVVICTTAVTASGGAVDVIVVWPYVLVLISLLWFVWLHVCVLSLSLHAFGFLECVW